MRTFKIGILGAGVISRTYLADLKAFYPRLEIVACAVIDVALAQALAPAFDIPPDYPVKELLTEAAVAIVINLTPHQFHL